MKSPTTSQFLVFLCLRSFATLLLLLCRETDDACDDDDDDDIGSKGIAPDTVVPSSGTRTIEACTKGKDAFSLCEPGEEAKLCQAAREFRVPRSGTYIQGAPPASVLVLSDEAHARLGVRRSKETWQSS